MRFVHDGSAAAPAFEVTVSDGALSSAPLQAAIQFVLTESPVLPGPAPDPTPDSVPRPAMGPSAQVPSPHGESAPALPEQAALAALEPAAPEGARSGAAGIGEREDALNAPETLEAPTAPESFAQMIERILARRDAPRSAGAPESQVELDLEAGAMTPLDALALGGIEAPTHSAEIAAFDEADRGLNVLLNPAQLGGIALSAGVVWWLMRAGGLLASLLASVPAWRNLDPLPILRRDDDDEDDVEWNTDADEEARRDERDVALVLSDEPPFGTRPW